MTHPCEAPWTQEGFPDCSKLVVVRAANREFMVDGNFGRPLTYVVIVFLLCFSGYCFVLFAVFTKTEVLVKERGETSGNFHTHCSFLFLEVGCVSSFYTKFHSHVRIADSESRAELGCAGVWLLRFSPPSCFW